MRGNFTPPQSLGGDEIHHEKLRKLLNSHRVVLRSRTVFPFELFPSEIVITENDVHFIMNIFLSSSEHKTFPLSSISLATCGTSAIFGSVRIELVGEVGNAHVIDHLWRDEAVKAVKIINGLRSCHHAKIDLSQFDLDYLKKQVALLGDY